MINNIKVSYESNEERVIGNNRSAKPHWIHQNIHDPTITKPIGWHNLVRHQPEKYHDIGPENHYKGLIPAHDWLNNVSFPS